MGADICTNCRESERDQELVTDAKTRPIELAHPASPPFIDNGPNYAEYSRSSRQNHSTESPEAETEMRQRFWVIVHNQLQYGDNSKVKEIESQYGPFQFDDRLINDGVQKVVVGPLVLENGATYYGHWYFKIFTKIKE